MWRCIFGPVLFYDLLHTARRGRHLIFRLLYAVLLAGLLLLLYSEEVGKRGGGWWEDWRVPQTQRAEVLRFNETFFIRFTLVQFALILLITPGVTAGAIAEEKERKTLEFMLTTELRGYEIVLGKLAARLAYMVLLILTGLPFLALLLLLGGLDPGLILASFIASGMTLLSIACLSIFNSVLAAKPRTAIFAAYAQVLAYFVTSLVIVEMSDRKYLPEPVEWFCAGNPYVALQDIIELVRTRGLLGPGLTGVVLVYCSFHAVVIGLFLAGSLVGLRWWNRRQASEGSRRAFVVFSKPKRLPRVGDRPVLWKELYAAPFLHVRRGGLILLTSIWVVGLLFGGLLVFAQIYFYFALENIPDGLSEYVNRLASATACLAALGAAIHSAGAFAGERDRQTFDSLLTTPLTKQAIFWGKWWGGFLSVRKAWYCLVVIWAVGLFTNKTDPLAVGLLAVASMVYVAFASSIGLWFSLRCRTTLRAMFWTLAVLILACGGHQVLTWFIEPLVAIRRPQYGIMALKEPSWFTNLVEFQTYGLTPPTTLNYLASTKAPRQIHWFGRISAAWKDSCVLGVGTYAACAALISLRVVKRFSRSTGRLPLSGK
jgi:ABC-type transport system involved in multi-copper enzyme maturation permease subunit